MTKTFREDPPKGIFENFREWGGSWGPDLQRAGKPQVWVFSCLLWSTFWRHFKVTRRQKIDYLYIYKVANCTAFQDEDTIVQAADLSPLVFSH